MPKSNALGAPISHREVVWLPGGENAATDWARHRRRALFFFNRDNIKGDALIDVEIIFQNEGDTTAAVQVLSSDTDLQPLGDPWEYDENDEFLNTFSEAETQFTIVPEGIKVVKLALAASIKYLLLQLDHTVDSPGGNVRAQVVSSNEKQLL